MQPVHNACVFIVDDDASVRDGMAWLLRSRRLMSASFASATAFEEMLGTRAEQVGTLPSQPGCILLDVRMPGQSGLVLFEKLVACGLAHAWPVIFLTGHADVPTAVDSVKRGAFDFCEKIYGIAGLAIVRTVPVMLLDYDFMGQPGDRVVSIRAGEKPVPEEFEYRLEMDLASLAYFKPGPCHDLFSNAVASRRG